MRSSPLFLIVAALLSGTRSAEAQRARVELTPFVGGYVPTHDLGSIQVPLGGGNQGLLEGRMNAGAEFGARLTYWASDRLGIEASYALSTGKLKVSAGGLSANFDAEVKVPSLKLLYQFTNNNSGSDFFFGAGVAGVRHSGQGFGLVGNMTDVAALAGPGVLITLSPQVHLRLDGDAMFYRYQAVSALPAKTQLDLQVSAGLAIRLTR